MTELQKKILDIYLEVEKLCKKYNLKYFAIAGTCLGAVRHKGFIPWDDDLDIAMPDDDYFRFMQIAREELPRPLQLLTPEDMPHSPCLFSKVHNVETTFIEAAELKYPDSYRGVFVDVFPLNGLPRRRIKRKLYICKLAFITRMNEMQKFRISDTKKIPGKLFWLISKPINSLLPGNFWVNKWYKSAFKYRFDSALETSYADCLSYKRPIFQTKWFRGDLRLPFENISILCPNDYDGYLKTEYGDYMKLPPESEQVSTHGGGIVDLSKPYRYYAESLVKCIL